MSWQSLDERESIPRDVQEFLDGYPGLVDDEGLRDNVDFYQGRIRCRPDGKTVDEIHAEWVFFSTTCPSMMADWDGW